MQQPIARYLPSPSDPWDRAKAAHLLNRAGFGGRPEEVDRVVRMGMEAAVDELIDFERVPESFPPPDFSSLRRLWDSLASLVRVGASERQRFEARALAQRADNEKLQELREWWVARMIQTGRPLQEKMVLFWHGLLVSGRPDARLTENLYRQNELFRRYALGNFKELILAICRDPAMLEYLDNESNRKGRPNENFARELMELFTMGVGHYTEQDVKEAARAFTGWTRRGFEFFFDAQAHDDGLKTLLGRTGNLDGGDVVEIIFAQPAAARYLPRRLFEYLAYPRPEDDLVEGLAAIFRHHHFEVAPLLRAILTSRAFYSPRAMRTQVKSPVQLVVGTARLLGLDGIPLAQLCRAMDLMGQALFYPPNVGGWPSGESWITTATILIRYNFSGLVLTDGMPGVARRPAVRPPLPPEVLKAATGVATAGEVINHLATMLNVAAADGQRKTAYLRALGAASPQASFTLASAESEARLRSALHLMMCSPDFQVA
ncbi:MAG: DUF1800 domain-containing protein [Armatimonadota bacterium]|nr:DUF1800 domain-containing protein [Armatimonadota bacterium]